MLSLSAMQMIYLFIEEGIASNFPNNAEWNVSKRLNL